MAAESASISGLSGGARGALLSLRALGRGLDATGSQATAPDAEGRLCDVVGVPAGAPSGSAIVALSQLVSQRAANASLRSSGGVSTDGEDGRKPKYDL